MITIIPSIENPFPGVTVVWPTDPSDPDAKIFIGEGTIFRTPCVVYWGCKIGNNCRISHFSVIREHCILGDFVKIGNGTTLDGHITVGNNVSIHTSCFIPTYTNIEDNVFIGPGCIITNTRRIKHGRTIPLVEEKTTIKYGTRIGAGCVLLPGVTIGREAMIGAGSVVTKNIPEYKTAFGVPAQITGNIPLDEHYPEKND